MLQSSIGSLGMYAPQPTNERNALQVFKYKYIYVYVYAFVYTYTYIYIFKTSHTQSKYPKRVSLLQPWGLLDAPWLGM